MYIDNYKVNTRKIKVSLMANIIHSVDAQFIKLCILKLNEIGIPSLFIHDSFICKWSSGPLIKRVIISVCYELFDNDFILLKNILNNDSFSVDFDKLKIILNLKAKKLVIHDDEMLSSNAVEY